MIRRYPIRTLLVIVVSTIVVYALARALSPGQINTPLWMAFEGMVLACVLSGAALITVAARARDRRRSTKRTSARACPHCGYDLADLPAPRCPECGKA